MANPTPIELSKTVQEQVLSAVKQSQDLTIAGIELWAKSVAPLAKAQPLPFASELPTPEQLAANSFGFAEKLLAAQKEFAERAIAAAAPVYATAVPASK